MNVGGEKAQQGPAGPARPSRPSQACGPGPLTPGAAAARATARTWADKATNIATAFQYPCSSRRWAAGAEDQRAHGKHRMDFIREECAPDHRPGLFVYLAGRAHARWRTLGPVSS